MPADPYGFWSHATPVQPERITAYSVQDVEILEPLELVRTLPFGFRV